MLLVNACYLKEDITIGGICINDFKNPADRPPRRGKITREHPTDITSSLLHVEEIEDHVETERERCVATKIDSRGRRLAVLHL